MSTPPDTKLSKYATPSIYKSTHLFDELPKCLFVPLGSKLDANLPVAVIVSDALLPRNVFPLTVKFAATVILSGNPIEI